MQLPHSSGATRGSRGFALRLLAVLFAGCGGSAALAQPGADRSTTQPAPPASSEAARYWLRVTGDGVNVRSRPDLNSRLVGRVSRDDVLEAVGSEFGWQRIVPPAGVFSLVSASYVERIGEQRGVVKVRTTLRVRVGSDIQPRDPLLSEVQTRLPRDAEVQILGELDANWLKIVPPVGVYVYISGDFVERISDEVANRLLAARPRRKSPPTGAVAARSGPAVAAAATQPVEPPDQNGRWGKQLAQALAVVTSTGRAPTDEQSWDALLDELRPIAAQRAEPQVARLAAAWVEKLRKCRRDQESLRSARQITRRAELDRARHARELDKIRRAKDQLTTQPSFDARGVLRPSFALPAGPYGLRYKLQDPFTHKVVAYVEFPTELGINVRASSGKYVGVRGAEQSAEGVSVPILRVTHLTVLNPDGPANPPARENP